MHRRNVIFRILSVAAFILLEIAAISLVRHSSSLQDEWFAKGGQAVRGFIWGTTEKWADYFSLTRSNDSLAQRNVELTEQLYNCMTAMGNGKMQENLAEDTRGGRYSFIAAGIVKISDNTQHNYLILDKGSEDGVSVGDGVITTKGAVGIIESASAHYSYAISLKNHKMSVSARLGFDGPVGSLQWDGKSGDGAVLSEIPRHIELHPGDTVFTSGFSYIFPADIPLGTTSEAKLKDGATYDINVRLFEDFSKLRYVAIVKDSDKKEISGLEDAVK